MSSQSTWTCDGVPKDGKSYPYSSGSHAPCQNSGPDCAMCGLPKEAMIPPSATVQGRKPILTPKSFPLLIVAVVLLAVGGYVLYRIWHPDPGPCEKSGNCPLPPPNPLISQGEKVLLKKTNNTKDNSQEKTDGASAFAAKKWDDATSRYKAAINKYPNDPEASIYCNNAYAEKAGSPLTMAVNVPISEDENTAKEILRGVALAQNDFNQKDCNKNNKDYQNQPPRLLEVVIVNEDSNKVVELAQDLIENYLNILAVLTPSASPKNEEAVYLYNDKKLALVYPLNTCVSISSNTCGVSPSKNGNGQGTLKTGSKKTTGELLEIYLKSETTTIAKYASKKKPAPKFAFFYNSKNTKYNNILKKDFKDAVLSVSGKVVHEVDISSNPSFNAKDEINKAKNAGANSIFLGLNKKDVEQAVAIAQANASSQRWLLFGSDDLYTPTILTKGGDAIKDIVLAVPWRYEEKDSFAEQAKSVWKGRVSWRTAASYDVTKALAEALKQAFSRQGVIQILNNGVTIPSVTAQSFNTFPPDKIPLVQASPGKEGPSPSHYQFDPI